LPVRRLPKGQLLYERRNGSFVLQVTPAILISACRSAAAPLCFASESIGTEEDGRPEGSLEGSDEAAVFFPACVHAKALQHLGSSPEPHHLALLASGESSQEDEYKSILGCAANFPSDHVWGLRNGYIPANGF
jgi:hypothetical protein